MAYNSTGGNETWRGAHRELKAKRHGWRIMAAAKINSLSVGNGLHVPSSTKGINLLAFLMTNVAASRRREKKPYCGGGKPCNKCMCSSSVSQQYATSIMIVWQRSSVVSSVALCSMCVVRQRWRNIFSIMAINPAAMWHHLSAFFALLSA